MFCCIVTNNVRSKAQTSVLKTKEEKMLVLVCISIVVLFVCCTTPAAVVLVFSSDDKLDDNIGYQVVICLHISTGRFLRFWQIYP